MLSAQHRHLGRTRLIMKSEEREERREATVPRATLGIAISFVFYFLALVIGCIYPPGVLMPMLVVGDSGLGMEQQCASDSGRTPAGGGHVAEAWTSRASTRRESFDADVWWL